MPDAVRRNMRARCKTAEAFLHAIAFSVAVLCVARGVNADSTPGHSIALERDWMIQSSCKVSASGARISLPGFRPDGWHASRVPSTVLAALVADKTYPNPYFGMNLRSIPGTTYPIGKNFSELPMPKDSPFRCSWWYRNEFRLPDAFKGSHVWLRFDGINNRANIWLNGHLTAPKSEIAGAFRSYEFEITRWLARGAGVNVLAAEVFAQGERDLGVNWNDWNPAPPDKDMGLWRGVWLCSTGPVELRYPQVATHFARGSLDEADLTVETDVHNADAQRVTGLLEIELEGFKLSQPIALAAHETRTVRFSPEQYANLRIHRPELWWPRQMGNPALHELRLKISTRDVVSDVASIRYGIREVGSELDARGHRVFRVNGKRILIRGGGWAPDMLLREDPERLKTEFRYVRDLNLNAIRLEGPMVPDEFFERADKEGVLVLAGWTCCDYWMDWKKWTAADLEIARASLRSQILRMRSHPSVVAWLNGSDEAPPAAVERAYVEELKKLDWPNPYLESASEKPDALGDPSGMKMLGPYDYTPPDYWLADTKQYGGAFGFASEISPGPAIPPGDSLRKFLASTDVTPGSSTWNYHAGGERFTNLRHFDEAMRAIYGPPVNFADYERKSQAMSYDSERAMFEAYSRNKYGSTGVIQWMLNNAWPSLIWHLYDYFLQPAGGYFGAKKACQPIHVQYSYDDRSVVVVNSTYENVAALKVTVQVYDAGLHPSYLQRSDVAVEPDEVAKALTIPADAFLSVSPVNYVELTLEDASGKLIDTNFYWLSTKKNVYDWANTDSYTAISSYENLTALGKLPSAGKLSASAGVERAPEGPLVRVKIQNPSDTLAFQVRLGIHRQGEGAEIAPVLWQDNYVELMPGESREITAQFLAPDALPADSQLTIAGWNVEPETIRLDRDAKAATDPGGVH